MDHVLTDSNNDDFTIASSDDENYPDDSTLPVLNETIGLIERFTSHGIHEPLPRRVVRKLPIPLWISKISGVKYCIAVCPLPTPNINISSTIMAQYTIERTFPTHTMGRKWMLHATSRCDSLRQTYPWHAFILVAQHSSRLFPSRCFGIYARIESTASLFFQRSGYCPFVPLSSLLTEATERIAAEAGDTIGALLNISFGNLVELMLL